MKNIAIIGAGGQGREVQWLIERINEVSNQKDDDKYWNILGYFDDKYPLGTLINDLPVIGNLEDLKRITSNLSICIAIGSAKTRRKIYQNICDNIYLEFPNLIDPTVQLSNFLSLGKGNIICCNCILTVNIKIGDFCLLNWASTIGHDSQINDFVTIYPGVRISGNTLLESNVEVGTGSQIIQGISIGENAIIGAGSTVIRNVTSNVTAVGNPCRVLKKYEYEK